MTKKKQQKKQQKTKTKTKQNKKQGDLDDAWELTAVWTYFIDNQAEQLFMFL